MALDGPSKNPACGSAACIAREWIPPWGAQVGEGVQWNDHLIICLAEYSVSPTVEGVLAGSPECGWHAGVGAPRRQQYRRECFASHRTISDRTTLKYQGEQRK